MDIRLQFSSQMPRSLFNHKYFLTGHTSSHGCFELLHFLRRKMGVLTISCHCLTSWTWSQSPFFILVFVIQVSVITKIPSLSLQFSSKLLITQLSQKHRCLPNQSICRKQIIKVFDLTNLWHFITIFFCQGFDHGFAFLLPFCGSSNK
jgi:hypothetical protein